MYCVSLPQAYRCPPPHTVTSLAGQPYTRSTVITAVKFLISDQPHSIDPLLKSYIGMCPTFPVSAVASPHSQGLELGRMSFKLARGVRHPKAALSVMSIRGRLLSEEICLWIPLPPAGSGHPRTPLLPDKPCFCICQVAMRSF